MQVTDHVHALRVDYEIRVSPTIRVKRFVYVYFIVGHRVHLIDTGIASTVGVIETYLTKMGRSLNDVATVVLTHGHADHMGGLKIIQLRSGCHVVAHALETPWVENSGLQVAKRPSVGFDQLMSGDVLVDQQVEDGDQVQLEPGIELKVIHTPGHSQGSVCYLLNGSEVLVTGDALAFGWGVPVYDDALVSLASVKRLQSLKPAACLLSSWDQPRFGPEVASIFDQCEDYLQTIHEAIRQEARDSHLIDPMVLCRAVLSRLKLPSVAANPLVASSLMSHVPYLNQAVLSVE